MSMPGVTVPATETPPVLSVIVKGVIVVAFMTWLKVAVIDDDTETPVAPDAGTFVVTVGGVGTATEPAVKPSENGVTSAFPVALVMAVDSVAV